MKKVNYILFSILAFFSLTAGVMYHSGTPGGKTGSPGDGGSNCTQCHGGTPVSGTGLISSSIPGTGYTPGQSYTVSLTGSHAGAQKYGFEMTSEDNTDAKMGEFVVTDATNTQLFNANSITHTAAGNAPIADGYDFSFDWTAPVVGSGDVTFYAAVNAANGNGNTGGDVIYLTSHTVTEEVITGINDPDSDNLFSFYPNPATDIINVSIPSNNGFLNIYNTSGVLVSSKEIYNNDVVNISELAKGAYFLTIVSENDTYKDKLIIK